MKPLEKTKPFPELNSPHLAEFRKSHYFVEADPSLGLLELCSPSRWGGQPRLQRGDWIEILATDNSFHVLLLVAGTISGHVILRVLWSVKEAETVDDVAGPDRVEYRPDRQWTALVGGEIIASNLPDREAAEQALVEYLGKAG